MTIEDEEKPVKDSTPGGKTLFAEFKMFLYLMLSELPKSRQNILDHLLNETDWGITGLVKNPNRAVQNWLQKIRETQEFEDYFWCDRNPIDQSEYIYLYRPWSKDVIKNEMAIEEACFRLMSDKFLRNILPTKFYENSLSDSFYKASARFEKYENSLNPNKLAVRSFLNKIAIAPRGQQLVNRNLPHDVLNVVYRAILDNRCVKMRYNNKKLVMHPYGIVAREPKFYLLGVDDKIIRQRTPEKGDIRQYLCNHIESAEVANDCLARVPDDFDVTDYVNKGGLDVMLREDIGVASDRSFTLKLRIYNGRDNLSRDLQTFPVSLTQRIEKEPGSEHEILTATGMRASHQLVEWILGRTNRVKVLAPEKLRIYISNQIETMHRLYTED